MVRLNTRSIAHSVFVEGMQLAKRGRHHEAALLRDALEKIVRQHSLSSADLKTIGCYPHGAATITITGRLWAIDSIFGRSRDKLNDQLVRKGLRHGIGLFKRSNFKKRDLEPLGIPLRIRRNFAVFDRFATRAVSSSDVTRRLQRTYLRCRR